MTGARLRMPWALLGGCAVLLVVLGAEWHYLGGETRAAQAAAPAGSQPAVSAAVAPFAPPPAARFSEIAERPLFIPDRRPQPDEEAAKQAPPRPPPTLAVQGVVLSPERSYAVIQHGNPPKLESIAEGATIDGWQVVNIDRAHVALRSGAATVEFPVGKSGRPAAAARRGRVVPSDGE